MPEPTVEHEPRRRYTTHSRIVTLFFPTVEAAEAWDERADDDLLGALRDLRGYEVSMEAGEEAEEADGE